MLLERLREIQYFFFHTVKQHVNQMSRFQYTYLRSINKELLEEGIARELINRIQNMRKDAGLEVTDRITLSIAHNDKIESAIASNKTYICGETLADDILICHVEPKNASPVEFDDIKTYIAFTN